MTDKIYVREYVDYLKQKASQQYNIPVEKCHLGHLLLQGMLDRPTAISQIDAATDEMETNISIAKRTMRLATAMNKYGLRPGDVVIIMGVNHNDLCIPFYACHFNGYSMCAIDPSINPVDLQAIFPFVKPKAVFCQQSCYDKVRTAFKKNNLKGEIITFEDKNNNLDVFVRDHQGTEINFKPAEFDDANTNAWLILTSGTTGLPKVAMIPFKTLLNGICCWWENYNESIGSTLTMATLQWLSSLLFYVSGPLRCFTRLQSSAPLTPVVLINIIHKYKPNAAAWTPFLLRQFLVAAENGCDLSSLQSIVVAGSAVEKPILDKFRKICPAYLQLIYGMTELLVPIFNFNEDTPDKASGTPKDRYEYKLIDEDGSTIYELDLPGELWVKGDDFFKGYLNNPAETQTMLTDDGWLKTGDLFYRDVHNYYYFVERKTLRIRHYGYWIAPLQLEELIKTHPGVQDACVVGIPDPESMEKPVAVIMRRNGNRFDAEEIFAIIRNALPPNKQLSGGLFFVEAFPMTASGKINRSKMRDIAVSAPKILPKH